ncbi:MAG: hypothetical protein R3E32_27890 [Chitinophagales bacterium]
MKTSKLLNILIFSLFLLSSNTYAQRFSRGNPSKVGTISDVSLQEDTPSIAKQKNSWLVNGLKMSESDQESLLKLLEQADEKNYRFTINSRNKQQTYGSLDLGSIRMTKKGSSNGLERSAGFSVIVSGSVITPL